MNTETADILRFSPLTIRKYILDGKINASKIGRKYRISFADICDFMIKHSTIVNEGQDKKPRFNSIVILEMDPHYLPRYYLQFLEEDAGITMDEVSKRLGLPKAVFFYFEYGQLDVLKTESFMNRLASILKVEPEELLKEEERYLIDRQNYENKMKGLLKPKR